MIFVPCVLRHRTPEKKTSCFWRFSSSASYDTGHHRPKQAVFAHFHPVHPVDRRPRLKTSCFLLFSSGLLSLLRSRLQKQAVFHHFWLERPTLGTSPTQKRGFHRVIDLWVEPASNFLDAAIKNKLFFTISSLERPTSWTFPDITEANYG